MTVTDELAAACRADTTPASERIRAR